MDKTLIPRVKTLRYTQKIPNGIIKCDKYPFPF